MNADSPFPKWKKNISLFLSGQAISLFGSAVVDYAIIWHITLETKSAMAMTIGILCSFVPRLLISLFSGIWADKYNRRYLIIGADAGIAFVTLLLAVFYLSGFNQLWLIFLVMGLRSIGTGIQTPAVNALIPQITPKGQLMRINGINNTIQSFIMLLAPAAGGALLSLIPLGVIFFVDVVTAMISIIIMFIIRIRHHLTEEEKKEKRERRYGEDMREGLRFTKNNAFVREMLIIYSFYYFLIAPAAFLSPLLVARVFGEEVWRLTANEIIFSLGMMIGGIVMARKNGFKDRITMIALSCFIVGVTTIILGISGFYLFLGATLIMGIFISISSSTEMALFQEKVDIKMQGRVFSLVQIVTTTIMPLAMLLFGPLGDLINVKLLFIICGILTLGLSLFIYTNKRLRKAVPVEGGGSVDK